MEAAKQLPPSGAERSEDALASRAALMLDGARNAPKER